MDEYQLSSRRVSPTFNDSAKLSLEEKVAILRKTLPAEKQAALAELKQEFSKRENQLQRRHETERPSLKREAYDAEHSRLIESIGGSKMPLPGKQVIEQKAQIAARTHATSKESNDMSRLKQRNLEQEYNFLKRAQPQHPLVREQTEKAKDRFNAAARKSERGAER